MEEPGLETGAKWVRTRSKRSWVTTDLQRCKGTSHVCLAPACGHPHFRDREIEAFAQSHA